MTIKRRNVIFAILAVTTIAALLLSTQLAAVGANMLLVRSRRHVNGPPPSTCTDATFNGPDIKLKGWSCRTAMPRRGTVIYLHGIGSNRTAGVGIVQRFTKRGFDVITYDSRGHGESDGEVATYGFYEKDDLGRVLDTLPAGERIVLIGASFGAAVALQAAAYDDRINAVVAAESFSDLRTIALHRAPPIFIGPLIEKAFRIAEERGRFTVDAVNVVATASRIKIPVLLIHGDADVDTPPEHSQRIFAALTAPKRLILVPGARHNQSLGGDIWPEIERWIDSALAPF